MGGCSEEIPFHVCLPERTQRIDDEDIRVEIQDAVQIPGQEKRRQKPVIHLPWILAAHRGSGKSRAVDQYRMEAVPEVSALASDRI